VRILVDDIRRGPDSRIEIAFSCAIGGGVATWRSAHGPPHAGRSYDVEIDIADSMELGRNTSILAAPRPAISGTEERARLSGTIDSVDEDGLVYLRLAPDCVVMIDASPGEFEPGHAVELDVPIASVELVPFGS
jgi:hypothetical protein